MKDLAVYSSIYQRYVENYLTKKQIPGMHRLNWRKKAALFILKLHRKMPHHRAFLLS